MVNGTGVGRGEAGAAALSFSVGMGLYGPAPQPEADIISILIGWCWLCRDRSPIHRGQGQSLAQHSEASLS